MVIRLMAKRAEGTQDASQPANVVREGREERTMATDDWLEDVRRWYYGGSPPVAESESDGTTASAELGYEAAHPALQARHWPDAPGPLPKPTT